MKGLAIAALAGFGLLASAGPVSADPWKDESGHGRWGGKPWKHEKYEKREGRGRGYYGDDGPRGYGYYDEKRFRRPYFD